MQKERFFNLRKFPSSSKWQSIIWMAHTLSMDSKRPFIFARTASFCLLAIFSSWRLHFYFVFLYSVCRSLQSAHYGVSQKNLKMLSQSQRQSRGDSQNRLKEDLLAIFQRSQTQRYTQKCVSEYATLFNKKASLTFPINLMPFSQTCITV